MGDLGALWDRHMRSGDWDAAWAISDTVLQARAGTTDWHRPRHLQAVWDGTAPAGRRVLVRCYHGLGDTIQFIRFVPQLQAIAAEVTVWAQPALLPLIGTLPGIGRLLPLHDGTPEAAFDVDIEVMELAHLFRPTPSTLPAQVPYLHPGRAARRSRDCLAVGLVWQAGAWDDSRSVPIALLRPLSEIPGVTLHILQRGAAAPGFGLASGADDILQAARMMTTLDLIVSVDSMPAHLAGALGLPVWTLLTHRADWRWMEGREDSPWYPTMRLLRQPGPGDWGAVVARLCRDLRALAAAHSLHSAPDNQDHAGS
ncbi:ADP-heptose--LPS heptosyltransferase [Siccirubricoccus deserti]|uniref:ADP-heptose--LPS heptosyltransferase n=2 Tax=Siccirubricoccus deserti TaxID=2013562 RepID=A0A9X0UE10_9PROT|nr:ADP-heptose--LPS heptosyltransferase [Siccirubricoccus deserti]